jgi:hypothetical protein
VTVPSKADLDVNPCWNSVPCGDPVAPASVSTGSFFKVAALILTGEARPRDDGQPLFLPTSSLCTDQPANRLDRPPRFVGLA